MLAKPAVAESRTESRDPQTPKGPLTTLRRLVDLGHRWLGLLVFGQVLLWSIGGILMYTLDFSDLYNDPPAKVLSLKQPSLSPAQLQQRLQVLAPKSELTGIEVRSVGSQPAYLLKLAKGPPLLLDEQGQRLDPIKPELAAEVARLGYTGSGKLATTELLQQSAGNYVSSKPIYRISFDDAQKTEIYVHPVTGELLARRKAMWGLYNRMWELHLMKYTPDPAINKALLLIFAGLNALVALTGFVKFFRWGYRLRRTPELAN